MFDSFKVNTDSYNDIISRFQNIESFGRFFTENLNELNWDALSASIGPIDDKLRSYFETLNNGNGTIDNASASVEGLSAHLRQTGQAYDFTALKAAALNTAMNAGIMALAGLVVTGLTHAWDAINVTAAETQEKIDEITASLTELNSEYNSLVSRDTDSLSQSEKERLKYLEDRIAKEEELLKIQEAKKAEEEIGGGFTDYFDKDSYTRKLSDEKGLSFTEPLQNFYNITDFIKGGSSENINILGINTQRSIDDYNRSNNQLELLKEQQKQYEVDSVLYNNLQSQIDKLSNYNYSDMQEQLNTWKEKKLNYEFAIDDLNEKINNPYLSNDSREQAKDELLEYESMLQAANTYIGQLDEILHSPQSMLESLDERLTRFSSEELNDLFTEDELTILYNASFDTNATENALRNIIADSQEQAADDPIYMPLSFEDRMLKAQDLSNDFDLFNKIYADIADGGTFDWSSILNNEEFKEKCEELGSIYDDFIQTVSNTPNDIEACQSAFDNLAETYLANSDALRYVTADTKDATVSMLEQMGVSNALEIVTNSLSFNEQALADSKSTVAQMAQTLAQTAKY